MNTLTLDELIGRLKEADDAYYNNDDPVMTDAEYDGLVAAYHAQTGETWMRMGGPREDLHPTAHVRPMLSLEKRHSIEEIVEFFGPETEVVLMPKVDGLSADHRYDVAGLSRTLTRGDGTTGEDVTHNAVLIPNMPVSLTTMMALRHVHVRGEVYLNAEGFAAVGGVNPRNSASGVLRRKSDTTQAKHLSFVAYGAFDPAKPAHEDATFRTMQELMLWLDGQGFDTVPCWVKKAGSITMEDLHAVVKDRRYETDGVVVMYNDMAMHRSLGLSNRAPKYAVAFKFANQTTKTILRDVEWSVGRTGRVVPTAIFDAVQLDGTTVTRATLHNLKNINDVLGGLAIGDEISVYKANMIIPQVEKVITRKGGKKIEAPVQCPSCGSQLHKTEVDMACGNSGGCQVQLIGAIVNAGERRKNLDIDGLGEEVAIAMVESGVVKNLADLFILDRATMFDVGSGDQVRRIQASGVDVLGAMAFGKSTFGTVRAKKLLNEIMKSRQKPWSVVLHALGCPGLGEPECQQIATKYGLAEVIENADERSGEFIGELTELKGIGAKTAETFVDWVRDNIEWLDTFEKQAGFNTQATPPEAPTGNQLAGMSFVITGTLSAPRHVYEALIKDQGGTVSGSVSSKTDYLLAGADAGSKLEKAKALAAKPKAKIRILDEAAFNQLVGR